MKGSRTPRFSGFMPAYIRPLFCEGSGRSLGRVSGDPEDIHRADAKVKELIPGDARLHRWLDMARERIRFQGLPARSCSVGLKDRARLGLALNEIVAQGELQRQSSLAAITSTPAPSRVRTVRRKR